MENDYHYIEHWETGEVKIFVDFECAMKWREVEHLANEHWSQPRKFEIVN